MCGISGIMTGNARLQAASSYVKDSLVAGSLRGMDSTGLASIGMKTGLFEWQKLPVNGSMFVTDKVASRLASEASVANTLTLAHTRAATTGAVSYNNAHPFVVEGELADGSYRELVGVHNGSLTSWKQKKFAVRYDVDSEWALNHIYDNGAEAFEDFDGAFCFVWWDSVNKSEVNFALNDLRPMHIAFLTDGSMAFASEPGMLAWLLERNNAKVDGNILCLTAGFHYKFDVANPKDFTKEPIAKYKAPVYAYHGTANRSTSSYTSSYTSVTAKMEALVAKTKLDSRPFVTKDEVERATHEQIQGMKGLFSPSYYDESLKELYGTFTYNTGTGDTEIFSTIRCASNLSWTVTSIFHVSILGVADDASSTVVCSYPTKKETAALNS